MKAQLLSLVLGVALLAGCYTAPVIPPIGFLYGNVSAPIDVDNNETQMGSKVGKATTTMIFGLFSWGDSSTMAAARDGNITTVRHADHEYLNVMLIYQAFTTVVRGD